MGPLAVAVSVEPAVRGGDTPECLEGSAGMQAVVGKTATDQHWHLDAVQLWGVRVVPRVVFGTCDQLRAHLLRHPRRTAGHHLHMIVKPSSRTPPG